MRHNSWYSSLTVSFFILISHLIFSFTFRPHVEEVDDTLLLEREGFDIILNNESSVTSDAKIYNVLAAYNTCLTFYSNMCLDDRFSNYQQNFA